MKWGFDTPLFCVKTKRSEKWETMLTCKQEYRKEEMSDDKDTGTSNERSPDTSKCKCEFYRRTNTSLLKLR